MKKLIQKFATVMALVSCIFLGQAQTTCLKDSSYSYNNTNTLTSKYFYKHNSSGLVSEQILKDSANGIWQNKTKYFNYYTTTGKLTNQTVQSWVANQWVNYFRYVYDYDANENQLTSLNQLWDTATNTWKLNGFQQYYFYNVNNKKTLNYQVFWGNGIVSDSTRLTYTYDANGNELTVLREVWTLSSPTWKNMQKWVNFNNANNQKDSSYNLLWNVNTLAFDTTIKDEYVYDIAGNQIEDIFYEGISFIWIKQIKYVDTYDANKNKTFQGRYTWQVATSTWRTDNEQTAVWNSNSQPVSGIYKSYDVPTTSLVNVYRFFYTYDANENLTESIIENWDASTSTWVPGSRTVYFIGCGNNVGIAETDAKGFQLYPNPANELLNIEVEAKAFTITITDIAGRKMMITENQKVISLNTLASGVYTIEIKTSEGTTRSTFVKQ